MKYKSIFALQRDSRELSVWFKAEMERFDRVNDLIKAVFDDDKTALAKSASPELEIAKSDIAVLRKEYGDKLGEDCLQSLAPAFRLRAIMKRWQSRHDAIAADERRSRRVNEIIENALVPHGGPWAVN